MAGIRQIKEFAEGVQVEMRRVTWPDGEQLRNATAVILVFVIILGIIIGGMDALFNWIVRTVVGVFSA